MGQVGGVEGLVSDGRVNLIVLRTQRLDLGIPFVEERHGDRPLHLAARGRLVLELYPLRKGEVDSTIRLGYAVPGLALLSPIDTGS